MISLQNEFLKVGINCKGAELTSLFNKLNGLEHLWQADPSVWAFHAPNLFPVVGSCMDMQILVEGKKYPMQRHGFARHSDFVLLESSETHAKFSLDHSEATYAVYPFKFTLQILYDLFDAELRVTYKVINQDDRAICFSIGAHPAFNVPFNNGGTYEEYYIEFDNNERLEKHLFNESGYFNGKKEPLDTEDNRLNLTKDLFKDGALVFKNLISREVLIKNHSTPNFISVSYPHFHSLGIWAPPGASFVCIEPWLGYADSEGELREFSEKDGIQKLEISKVFECSFTIGIN